MEILTGYKTYLIAIGLIIGGISLYLTGDVTGGLNMIGLGMLGLTGRDAIKKIEK